MNILQWNNYINPNTFAGLMGKVRKKTISRKRKEGRVEKKAHATHPWEPGLEPGTCHVLGEGPQLHIRGLFRQAILSMPIGRVGRLRNTMCCMFWR